LLILLTVTLAGAVSPINPTKRITPDCSAALNEIGKCGSGNSDIPRLYGQLANKRASPHHGGIENHRRRKKSGVAAGNWTG